MNIDDQELAKYIKDSQRSGESVRKRDFIGQWERKVNGADNVYYEFLENDTFRLKSLAHYSNPFYDGEILWIMNYSGTWYVWDDSLYLAWDAKSAEVQVDRSGVTYRPEMRDSVERFISRYFNEKKATEEIRKNLESHPRKDTFLVTTNKAHDKLEMVVSRNKDGGVKSHYLKRMKESSVSDFK